MEDKIYQLRNPLLPEDIETYIFKEIHIHGHDGLACVLVDEHNRINEIICNYYEKEDKNSKLKDMLLLNGNKKNATNYQRNIINKFSNTYWYRCFFE